MKYLGLDLGTRTLGVSISDITKTIATAYGTIRFEEDNYEKAISKLSTIMEKEPIEKIILGFPKNMNGTVGPRALVTLEFKKKLEDTFKIPVEMQDERLSTKEASGYMIKADISRKKRKQKIDSLAANIILQTYLDKRKDWKNMQENGTVKFKAIDEEGRQLDCEALFLFESPETKKNYIVYTDHSIDNEGNTKVYASIYDPKDLKSDENNEFAALPLKPIETEKEWKIIETILNEMQSQIESASNPASQATSQTE